MKYILIVLYSLIFLSCNGQNNFKKIEYNFKPSFLHKTRFTIDINKKTLEQYTYQDRYRIKEKGNGKSYKVRFVDTLIVHNQNRFTIPKSDLKYFLNEITDVKLDTNITIKKFVMDGIRYSINLSNKKNLVTINSNYTKRGVDETKTSYTLIDAFFNLSYKILNEKESIKTLENIQDYFDYGLPIKKVSNEPIEYRVWGSVSGCRDNNSELINLLNNLPNKKPVIFDLRNGSFSYCLNAVLIEYSKKKQIFLYGDKSANRSKKILDEIELAEKNGEKLNKLRVQAYETHKRIFNRWKENKSLNSFLTRDEVLKTIANTIYSK